MATVVDPTLRQNLIIQINHVTGSTYCNSSPISPVLRFLMHLSHCCKLCLEDSFQQHVPLHGLVCCSLEVSCFAAAGTIEEEVKRSPTAEFLYFACFLENQVHHFYRSPGILPATVSALLRKAREICPDAAIESIATEHCFNVEVSRAT